MKCSNCGESLEYKHVYPVDRDLAETWELSSGYLHLFNEREGLICVHCGVNKRAQSLAQAVLVSKYGFGASSLKDWVKEANKRNLKVCELNSCHELHKTLKFLKKLTYAEYGTKTEQNIEKLTYSDSMFDLVLHSETLEHVNDPGAAMDECRRVLRPDGLVIFTTPIIWSRHTRRRATIDKGKIKYLLPASHHGYKTDDYLVYHEYGSNIAELLGCKVMYAESAYQAYVFSCGKERDSITLLNKIRYKAAESRAVRKVSRA